MHRMTGEELANLEHNRIRDAQAAAEAAKTISIPLEPELRKALIVAARSQSKTLERFVLHVLTREVSAAKEKRP